ncbi:MAG: hexokinase family protein [Bacteroidales bacterium]
MSNLLNLDIKQQKNISNSFCEKVLQGLDKEGQELLCIPTYVSPIEGELNGAVTVVDFGGTNLRVAVVEFKKGVAVVTHGPVGKKLDPELGETRSLEALFKAIAGLVNVLGYEEETPIGYCYSYPATSLKDGDAIGIGMSKDLAITELIGSKIGKPLLDYLNKNCKSKFSDIKVANDTITTLFAGKTLPGFDSYIGLIVGTGTNMATFFHTSRINKDIESWEGILPINLESGNFTPDVLTELDKIVDDKSSNKGKQKFEKAVSGMFVGRLLNAAFPDKFDEHTDGKYMSYVIDNPKKFDTEAVELSQDAYKRSAKLVASTIAGLILSGNPPTDRTYRVLIVAEGSLFWSHLSEYKDYNKMVKKYLRDLLDHMHYSNVQFDIQRVENANLIGAAIVAMA